MGRGIGRVNHVTERMSQRGISKSYPIFSISKRHGVPYWVALGASDYMRVQSLSGNVIPPLSASQHRSMEWMTGNMHDLDHLELVGDLMLAREHFELIRDGKILM